MSDQITHQDVQVLIRDAMSNFIDRRIVRQSAQEYVRSRYPWLQDEVSQDKKVSEVVWRCQIAQSIKRLAGPIADLITQELNEMDRSEDEESIAYAVIDAALSPGDEHEQG